MRWFWQKKEQSYNNIAHIYRVVDVETALAFDNLACINDVTNIVASQANGLKPKSYTIGYAKREYKTFKGFERNVKKLKHKKLDISFITYPDDREWEYRKNMMVFYNDTLNDPSPQTPTCWCWN